MGSGGLAVASRRAAGRLAAISARAGFAKVVASFP
jgi:hypothetical protein